MEIEYSLGIEGVMSAIKLVVPAKNEKKSDLMQLTLNQVLAGSVTLQ